MKSSPIRLGGQLAAVAALPFFPTQALADVQSFRAVDLRALTDLAGISWKQDALHLADVARFYDDGLTHPQWAFTDLAGISWKQETIHLADVARFYDDGLTHPQGALTDLAGISWKQETIHLADVARFYDDGLTHPQGALTDLAGISWKQETIHLTDAARFYDDGLTHPMQVIDTPSYQNYDYRNRITPNPIPEIKIANQIWPIVVE